MPLSLACQVMSLAGAAGPTRLSETASIATIGGFTSFTMLVVCEPWLPAASVTLTRTVFAPSLSWPALTVVVCWAGAPV